MRSSGFGWRAAFPAALVAVLCGLGACGGESGKTGRAKQAFAVPFVGCPMDGQAGPKAPPVRQPLMVAVSKEMAGELAYYQTELGLAVLGPRGWHCFGLYGSGGDHLYLSPDPVGPDHGPFHGNIVVATHSYSGTSGRYTVAEVIARVFPKYRAQAIQTLTGIDVPAQRIPTGPFPDDELSYRDDRVLEFTTPAWRDGLGTWDTSIQKNGEPIWGTAVLFGPGPDLRTLSLRLPGKLAQLQAIIVSRFIDDTRKLPTN